MGLAIAVGILAELKEVDPEGLQYYRETFAAVDDLLAKAGLPPHHEPEELPPLENRCELDSYPYSFIHHLRRAYAHRVENPSSVVQPVAEGEDPVDDPAYDRQGATLESHLLCHSDAEGFYLPLDFQDVIFDDSERVPGGMVGSSHRLRAELLFVAPAIGIWVSPEGDLPDDEVAAINAVMEQQDGPLWIERIVWLSLFEAARLSIEHKAAICFT